jgi:tetratricopeptide (TPR) repeat protein
MSIDQSHDGRELRSEPAIGDVVISSAERGHLQRVFDHGKQVVARGNYDFDKVNELFSQCVIADPGNSLYVDAFLDNLSRKYKNNMKGALLHVFSGKGAFKKAVAREDWIQVFKLGPSVLRTNPWDTRTLQGMATACEHQNDASFHLAEIRYLKNALARDPKNAEPNRQMAKMLGRMGRFEEAIPYWQQVIISLPDDAEAKETLEMLTGKTGVEDEAKPAQPALVPTTRDREDQILEEQVSRLIRRPSAGQKDPLAEEKKPERRQIPLTQRQELEQRIHNDPSDTESYLQLAEILALDERYGEAKRVLEKACSASPGEIHVRERLEDLRLRQARNQLAIAEMQAARLETAQARELASRLKEELAQLELEQFTVRTERYPDEPGVRFELGLRLKKSGNYGEAIKQFQPAAEAIEQKAAALIAWGECSQHLRQYDKALNNYLVASELAKQQEKHDCQKLALYRAGVLATGMNQLETAVKCLQTLVALDDDYKDAQSRLDKLKKITDKG